MNCCTRLNCPICFEAFKNEDEIVILDCNQNDWVHSSCLLINVKNQDAEHICFICGWEYHKILYEFEALAESAFDECSNSHFDDGSYRPANVIMVDDISDELE
jgi:hypothetical protein